MKNKIVKIIKSGIVLVGLFSLSSAMAEVRVFAGPALSNIYRATNMELPEGHRISSLSSEAGIGVSLSEKLSLSVSYGEYDELNRLGGYDIFGNGYEPTDLERYVRAVNFRLKFIPIMSATRPLAYAQLGYSKWNSMVTLTSGNSVNRESNSGSGYNYGLGIQSNVSRDGAVFAEINEFRLGHITIDSAIIGGQIVFH